MSNCFIIQEVIGFVADLVVEDDPESSWQDYFRKNTKSSNDQRLRLLYNLRYSIRCHSSALISLVVRLFAVKSARR